MAASAPTATPAARAEEEEDEEEEEENEAGEQRALEADVDIAPPSHLPSSQPPGPASGEVVSSEARRVVEYPETGPDLTQRIHQVEGLLAYIRQTLLDSIAPNAGGVAPSTTARTDVEAQV